MHYQDVPAPAALRAFVDRLWVLETVAGDTAIDPILPDGHPEIIVHGRTPFGAIADGHVVPQPPVLFAGQLTGAVHIASRGPTRVVGARLRPHAARAFVPGPQHALTDRVVDLTPLNPSLARALRRGRTSTATRDDDLARVAAVLEAAVAGAVLDHAVDRAVSRAVGARGLVRVADLSRAARVGPRQLERLFRRDVGVTPKLWLRTIRFQEVLRTIREGGSRRWVNVALQHGFYDQAHFVTDFKAFTGQPPSGWNVSDESLTAVFSAVRRRRLSAAG